MVVIETKDNTTVDASIPTGSGSTLEAIALKPDGSRPYVTLSGFNSLLTINNTTSPPAAIGAAFALTASMPTPLGIATALHGTDTYAYIAKQNSSSAGSLDIVNIDTDALSLVTSLAAGPTGSSPNSVAVTPNGSRLYITLRGSNQFAVIDNTLSPPAAISGSPFGLTASSTPLGVAIPPLNPLPGTGARVFISESGLEDVAIIDD